MKPIKFKESNVTYGEGQKEYLPLPAHLDAGVKGYVITCWKLSIIERIRLFITGRLWLSQMSFQQPLQPQYATTKKSDIFNRKPSKIVKAWNRIAHFLNMTK